MKTIWLYTSRAEVADESATRAVHRITSAQELGEAILKFANDYKRYPEIMVAVEDSA